MSNNINDKRLIYYNYGISLILISFRCFWFCHIFGVKIGFWLMLFIFFISDHDFDFDLIYSVYFHLSHVMLILSHCVHFDFEPCYLFWMDLLDFRAKFFKYRLCIYFQLNTVIIYNFYPAPTFPIIFVPSKVWAGVFQPTFPVVNNLTAEILPPFGWGKNLAQNCFSTKLNMLDYIISTGCHCS